MSEIDSDEYLFYQQQLKNEEEKYKKSHKTTNSNYLSVDDKSLPYNYTQQQQHQQHQQQQLPTAVAVMQQKSNPKPKPPAPKIQLGNIKEFETGSKATNMKFSQNQFTSEKFTFRTLEVLMKDDRGDEVPGYTIGQYKIFGDSQTKWTEYNVDALYYIREGEAWFLIGDDGKTLTVGYYLCVPRNTRHCIYNKSNYVECIVDLIFPGKILLG